MSENKLARMANDIADFFQSYPHDEAVTGIHDHIVAFWTPKMRMKLHQAIGAGIENLNPLVADAFAAPPAALSPAEKASAGPSEVGEIGASDAG